MCSPRGIALTPSGDVFVGSDCFSPHLARFTATGAFLGTWGLGTGFQGPPNGVAIDGAGNLFVTDYDGLSVVKFSSTGARLTSWTTTTPPVDIVVNGSGEVFVSEITGRRVVKYTNNGVSLGTIGVAGSGPGQYDVPQGIGMDATGRLYVADWGRKRILRYLANGTFDMEFATSGQPYDVAAGPDGNVYVVFLGGGAIGYSPAGALLFGLPTPDGASGAFRIVIGPTGAIYFAEQNSNRVTWYQMASSTSAQRTTFGRLKALYR